MITFTINILFATITISALKKIANDFVFGFIQAVDGEKVRGRLIFK